MLVGAEGAQPRERGTVVGPAGPAGQVHLAQGRHQPLADLTVPRHVLHRAQQGVGDARLAEHRDQPCPAGAGDGHLGRAPRGADVGGGDQADHGVGGTQPLVQALLPLVAADDPVDRVPIEEGVVPGGHQPAVDVGRLRRVLARMADEDARHVLPFALTRTGERGAWHSDVR